jgi:glycosyltransferase involved in cell wall biosynthesis
MRIAMIGQKGIPCTGGGVERHVEDLSRHLAARGYEVTVYTRPHYTSARLKDFHGVRLVSLPSIHSKHLDALSHSLYATVHAIMRHYDIIHYHGVGPALCAWIPRVFAPRIKVVGTYHCDDWKQGKWGLVAKTMLRVGAWMISRIPHMTIAVSREIYASLVQKGSRACYIPSGVNLPDARPSRSVLKQFGLARTPYILVASRFVRHKCIHDAINAFKRLKAHPTSSARIKSLKLVLVGGGAFTDDYLKELKQLSENRDDIVFTGYQSGVALQALFAHAALFLQPSTMEGRSIALLEAIAWGIPVAAADIEESREVLAGTGGKMGTLFQPHQLPEIADAMHTAIVQPRTMQQMAHEAYALIAREYDWNKIIAILDDLYIRLSADALHAADLRVAVEHSGR